MKTLWVLRYQINWGLRGSKVYRYFYFQKKPTDAQVEACLRAKFNGGFNEQAYDLTRHGFEIP